MPPCSLSLSHNFANLYIFLVISYLSGSNTNDECIQFVLLFPVLNSFSSCSADRVPVVDVRGPEGEHGQAARPQSSDSRGGHQQREGLLLLCDRRERADGASGVLLRERVTL